MHLRVIVLLVAVALAMPMLSETRRSRKKPQPAAQVVSALAAASDPGATTPASCWQTPDATTVAETTSTPAATFSALDPATEASAPDMHQVTIQSACGQAITIYTLQDGPNQPTVYHLAGNTNQQRSLEFPRNWAGRVWARYDDVDPLVAALPGTRPDFWLNFLFDGQPNMDNYYMSSVDGFSVPLSVAPIAGTFTTNDAIVHQCRSISCTTDFLANCPPELKVVDFNTNKTVACDSACTKFGGADYCCNAPNTTSPQTCHQNQYGAIIKAACQDVKSYAFDDASSTFFCTAAQNQTSGYAINFCPSGNSSDSRTPAVPRNDPGPNDPGHIVTFKNNCKRNLTLFTRENGGWPLTTIDLPAGSNTTQKKALSWGGRFWARYDEFVTVMAQYDGVRVQPDSLFEIRFDGWAELDFYDISLVDGFSVPLAAKPIPGTFQVQNPNSSYSCGNITCLTDIMAVCPPELMQNETGLAAPVACNSACSAFNSDQYCCHGAYSTPDQCPATSYSNLFKAKCPDAYSYAYDDTISTYTCMSLDKGNNIYSGYAVEFCADDSSLMIDMNAALVHFI